jgi:hypothetical protein
MSKRDSEHPQHDQQKPVPDLRARLRLHARRDARGGSGKAGFGRVGMRVLHSEENGAHLRRVPRAPRIRIPRLRVPRRLTRTLAWSTRLAHSPRWQKGLRRGRCRTHNAHGRRPCGFLSPGSSTERRPRPESMLIRGTRNDAALFLCLISKLLAGARSSTTQAGIRTECYLTT